VDLQKTLYTASTWVLPVLIAITFHEAAHAYAAWKLGDDTAYRQGRVTFNPLKHVDPLGTILIPALLLLTASPFLFGWARPVRVAFHRLSQPRRDMALVAIAGPLTNVALAVISATHTPFRLGDAIARYRLVLSNPRSFRKSLRPPGIPPRSRRHHAFHWRPASGAWGWRAARSRVCDRWARWRPRYAAFAKVILSFATRPLMMLVGGAIAALGLAGVGLSFAWTAQMTSMMVLGLGSSCSTTQCRRR
jgi:hypothetical protein